MGDTERHLTITQATLDELRRELVAASHEHRATEDALRTARALAEHQAITAAGSVYASLKNEGERARFLTLALSTDNDYSSALEAESDARAEVEAIRAEIDIRDDARKARAADQRDRELDIRAAEVAVEERRLVIDETLSAAYRAELDARASGSGS